MNATRIDSSGVIHAAYASRPYDAGEYRECQRVILPGKMRGEELKKIIGNSVCGIVEHNIGGGTHVRQIVKK